MTDLSQAAQQHAGSGVPSAIDPSAKDPRGDPIGVPENYVAPVWIPGVGPYRPGMPLSPAQQAFADSAQQQWRNEQASAAGAGASAKNPDLYRTLDAYEPANDPSKILELQQKLIQAGLLDPTQPGYAPGIWGPAEVQAYTAVLLRANINGGKAVGADEMLDYLVQHPGADVTAGKQITLTSPIDAGQVFDQVVKQSLGKKVTGPDRQKFIDAWTAYETSVLTGNAAAAGAAQKNPLGTTQPTTDPASLSNFAQQYVDTNYAGEEANVGYQHGLDLITSLIGSTKGAGG